MKNIIIILCAFYLSSCSILGAYVDSPMKKLGVIIDVKGGGVCYERQGYFFVKEMRKRYELTSPLIPRYKELVKSTFNKHGNTPVFIDISDLKVDRQIIDDSVWSKASYINEHYKQYLFDQISQNQLDAILTFSKYDNYGREDCSRLLYVGTHLGGMAAHVMIDVNLFNKELYFSHDISSGVNISVNSKPLAAQPRELDKQLINNIELSIIKKMSETLDVFLEKL